MRRVISLNGLDRSGKSTQAEKIKSHYGLVKVIGKLKRYNTWPDLSGIDYFNWWFRDGSTENFVRTIYTNIARRNKEVNELDLPIIILDRGNVMFDAVCIATTAVREKWFVEKARRFTEGIKEEYNISNPADLDLFFMHGKNPGEMCRKSSEREDTSHLDDKSRLLYQRYQRVLANVLTNQLRASLKMFYLLN